MGWLFKNIILVVGLVIMALLSVVGAIGLGFNVQQIRENIAIWGLTWFEAGSIGFAIAFWVVVLKLLWRLNKYEKVRPSLWVRKMGGTLLSDPIKQPYPHRLAWYADVNIANTSSDKRLGIRSLLLRRKYGNTTANIRSTIGTPESAHSNAPKGDMGDNFTLEPCESKSGRLVFVEEFRNEREKEKLSQPQGKLPLALNIVIIDGQNKEHVFTVQPQDITWR